MTVLNMKRNENVCIKKLWSTVFKQRKECLMKKITSQSDDDIQIDCIDEESVSITKNKLHENSQF